jgi:hypothetical protein
MKKLLFLLLLLPFAVFGQTTYQLNYDSIRVNKTAGTGGTSMYGKVYLKNVSAGLGSDSVLSVRNGRIFKIGAVTSVDSTVYRTVANSVSLAGLQTRLNAYLPLTGGTLSGGLTGTTLTLSSNSNLITGTPVTNTNRVATLFSNLSGNIVFGANGNSANDLLGNSGIYQALIGTTTANSFGIGTSNSVRYTISSGGDNTWTGSGTFAGVLNTNAENAISAANSGTTRKYALWSNTAGGFLWGLEGGSGGSLFTNDDPYSGVIGSTVNRSFHIATNNTVRQTITGGGGVNFTTLAGVGTRMVVADNTGTISTQAIPGGGGGSVTGVAVATANGLAGTSDGAAVAPTLTLTTTINSPLLAGDGTAISAASTTGTGSTAVLSAAPSLTGTVTSAGTINTNAETAISATSAGTDRRFGSWTNTSGGILWGIEGSSGGSIITGAPAYSTILGNTVNKPVIIGTNNVVRLTVDAASVFSGTVAASNLSGTNTGDQTTITGNAGTATALQTARNIQGVSFNGTADINPINGTGFVKATGTTLSYDNTAYAPLASPALTGNPTAPTQTAADNSTKLATTAYVDNAGTFKANLNSPALTGTPTAPTASAGTNNTQIATTAYVDKFNLTSGTYTPTFISGSNLAGYTITQAQYMRVGNTVTVSGQLLVEPSITTNKIFFSLSLPIASNITIPGNLGGSGAIISTTTNPAYIEGSVSDDAARFIVLNPDASQVALSYSYTYLIQ